jgi:hypothetical protein
MTERRLTTNTGWQLDPNNGSRRMNSLSKLTLASVACLLPFAPIAACSCIALGDHEQEVRIAFADAGAVVVAKAVSVVMHKSALVIHDAATQDFDAQLVTWTVDKSWKGTLDKGQSFETDTVTECCMCGRSVEKGDVYVIYLSRKPPYEIGVCGPGNALSKVKDDPALLDKIKAEESTH